MQENFIFESSTMTRKEIKSLFPLKGKITQEIIDTANPSHPLKCIGARTLKASLGKNANKFITTWGTTVGSICEFFDFWQGGCLLYISTKENINMMDVKSPQSVTFILSE